MRKRILRDYVLVVTAALLCGFLIFYLVVSNIMMESTRRTICEYVLQTIRSIAAWKTSSSRKMISHRFAQRG